MSDIDRLSVWAARYALGRATYAVQDVVEVLSRRRDELSRQSREVICRDIDEAEARGGLGMEMDAVQWRNLRDALADDARDRATEAALRAVGHYVTPGAATDHAFEQGRDSIDGVYVCGHPTRLGVRCGMPREDHWMPTDPRPVPGR